MPNIAAVLREEVSRLARKEIRKQTETLRKAATQARKDVAEMKRRISDLQRKVTFLEKRVLRETPSQVTKADAGGARFSAKGLRSHRKRLGLSAGAYGKLIGVTGQTVYKWENEAVRPRKQQLEVLAGLRRLGKKEARTRLDQPAKEGQRKS